MNSDNNPNTTNNLTPELEARVVAWVAGEASAFEIAELERLTTDKPELAIFKRRMQAVQGLVAEAVRPEKEPLRLSPERRAKLLKEMGANNNQMITAKSVDRLLVAAQKAQRKSRRWMMALAACLTAGLLVAISIPSFRKDRSMGAREVALSGGYESESPPTLSMMVPNEMKLAEEEKHYFSKAKSVVRPVPTDTVGPQEMAKSEISAREFEKKRREEKPTSPTGTGNEVAFGRQARRRAPVSPPASVPAPVSTEASTGSERGIAGKFSDVLHDYKGNASDGDGNAPGVMQTDQSASDGPAGGANRVAGTADEEVLVLSPFAVTASKDMGYIATNTLAGSRKQTKLENPPNSIALATEQPAADLPARDVNGIVSGDLAMEGARPFKSDALKEIDQLSDARLEKAPQVKRHSEPVPVASNLTEVSAAKEPVSTFSLHVSDVSFKIAKDALAKGEEIDRERIRPEEFYNAFAYGDPSPALNEKISCHIEQAAHPLLQQRNLVRIAMKVAAAGRAAGQPLRLTVLLDTSGSMEREDRVATVRGAMAALVGLLGPNDRVTLIGFARQPRLLAESVAGDQAAELLNIIANTPAEGGTNLEEALKLGGELAQRQFEATAQNRLVLLTDGAANLGNADPGQLAASIEALRQKGIALDACGVGMEGLDDAMLEALTRKSDGRYYALNSPEDADAGFARQLAGALRPAANNVKLQVRFNPARVGSYRLIGFEKHRLREEDFRNDKVDAAELAAEEAAVAVYQVEPLPQGEGELGEVFVRFLDASTGTMVERSWTLPYEPQAPAFDRASPTLQLAGTAALVAEALQRGGKEDVARLGELTPIVNGLRGYFPHNERVADLVTMFAQLKKFEH